MRNTILLPLLLSFAPAAVAADIDLAKLKAGQAVRGFRVASVYLDASDKPIGARFTHPRTGYTLDLLQIESVPQSYTWVNSMPVSDQGEPHTQEHLLLAKGTAGRTLSTRQTISLAGYTAFTQQWRTSYMFNTVAGPDVFFDLFAEQQRAMLHPNYSDEEIRREVRNFGVAQDPDGTLRLEEQGTVYNEMVSSAANPLSRAFRAAGRLVYGEQHPLAFNAGGEPSGIRTMKPKHIRDFHRSTHHLASMGSIAAFPKNVALGNVLQRFDRILRQDAPAGARRRAQSLADLPQPQAAAAGSILFLEYPHRNEQQPSPFSLVWPAARELDANEQLLADLFFANLAGDPTTNLYKLFIDSRTRKIDLGARSVSGSVRRYGGHPIFVGFTDVSPAHLSEEKLRAVRTLVVDEIRRIAELPDGSPELEAFNERLASRVIERERDLAKFVGTPPRFGFRDGGSQWMDHMLTLEKAPETRKSLTLKPQLTFVRELLASRRNFWREYLAKWQVAGVTPYVAGARPSPALLQREDAERAARVSDETARLQRKYGLADAQEAIRRYRVEADAEAARIEEEAKKVPPIGFVKSPPMTLDDELRFDVARLASGVPLVASQFDSMTGAMAGIALRLDGVPREELRYVSLLPTLLTRVGVIENGKPVSYEEMSERLRKEILSLDAGFATNTRTGRVELVVRGAGIGAEESHRAIDWMMLVLHSPDWRPENLPRIRDVVDQAVSQLRNTMQGAEETWVNNPADAYRMQRSPTFLAADSFLTRSHNALRLRWLLKDAAAGDADALAAFLTRLAESGRSLSRNELKTLLTGGKAPGFEALPPSARSIAGDALTDLDLCLIEIPDSSLGADFAYLVTAIRDDLLAPAAEALARMDAARRRILNAGSARMFTASSGEMRKTIVSRIEAVAAKLENTPPVAANHASEPHIDMRLRQRHPDAAIPLHVGLYSPNKQGGVITTSVPSVHYSAFDDKQKQLDYLASRLHSGGGTHSIFLKTIGAGLAYSNGLRASVSGGRRGYYAERTPELPQTVRFVVNTLKDAQVDPHLGEYAIAQAFGEFRSAATYEARAEGMAADLADDQPPEQVRKFRQSILELRKDPNLGNVLFQRKDRVYGEMIPGYDAKRSEVPGAVYFVVGPDKQLDAWDQYLKITQGPGMRLYKLYGRDFWMP